MIIGRIRNSTHVYKGPEGVDNVGDLHVRVEEVEGMGRCCVSAWIPTPAELKLLNDGQPIHLHIFGAGHPVVALSVPED